MPDTPIAPTAPTAHAKPIAGRYEIREPLDSGGMGGVWRGYDATLDRQVAVKRVRPDAVVGHAEAEEFVKRFRREARITARIQHPGVPQVYDAVLDDACERLYLVMEFVDGLSLSAYIDPSRPLPIDWAASIAAQVATVLSYAHEIPVVHRDLKPSNILVAADGTAKVLDFGIAAILRTDVTRLTATGRAMGTAPYMSPEQVRGAPVSPRSDLYALGCVLHELLSGHRLFTGDEFQLMRQHIASAPIPLRTLRGDVPEALERLVLDLLLKAPEARPADAQEVYERLRPFLPAPGEAGERPAGEAAQLPDPTRVFRLPYAPRPRASETRPITTPTQPSQQPDMPTAAMREEIKAARAAYRALLDDQRFTQAADVMNDMIAPAARALGRDNKIVLDLRKRRAVSQLLGGDFRAALPEFDTLVRAYGRVEGPQSENALQCRAQAARCRGALGQATAALAELRAALDGVRSREGDVSEDAIELRHDIGMLLLSQGRLGEAIAVLEPLCADLELVYGAEHDLTRDVAEALALAKVTRDRQAD